MSRNSIFILLGVISAGVAYFFYPSFIALVQSAIAENLPHDFSRMLQKNDLVVFAGFISLFGLSFFLLYIIFPVSYVWYHINSAQNIVAALPVASNELKRTSKQTFLSQLKEMGFIGRLANSYGGSLIQEAEREVSAETLKNIRFIKKNVSRNKSRKIVVAPVRATISAAEIFNVDSLLNDHLLLGFFNIFAWVIAATGAIIFGISQLSPVQTGGGQITLMPAMQPGMVALLYCLASATIIMAGVRLLELVLAQNSRSLARKIDDLFDHGQWQQDIKDLQSHLLDNSVTEQIETILRNSFDKPVREISRAIKLLAAEQEKKLNNILLKTLENFTGNLEKKSATNTENLNQALKDATDSAELMKKQLVGANSDFSRQMDKQATTIARHLANMQKVLTSSEKTTRTGSEKLIATLTTEVNATYAQLDGFIKSNLKKLDDRQAKIDTALNDKNSILKDLHNSAKDLGTISNASGMLLERFIALSAELDNLLRKNGKNNPPQSDGNMDRLSQLRRAMIDLKQANSDRTGKLPEM